MDDVTNHKDYGLRAVKTTNDELGTLVEGFNDMLARIETQHRELTNYRENLEQLVEKRTWQLRNSNERLNVTVEKLKEANAESEAANKAKSEFLTNMSHELRTPLNAIIGFSELISSEAFGPIGEKRYLDYVSDISTSGSHLLDIINDILDMTKIEVGNFHLKEENVQLKSILEEAYRIIKKSAEDKGIHFPVPTVPAEDVVLLCDATRLRQVLLNLLANAVKFTDQGGTIDISVQMESDGIVIRVTDTGIGMSEEHLEHVLTPFGQVESAYSRNFDGVGLGLALSDSLIREHGGTLKIDSTLGKGTTIIINLPNYRLNNHNAQPTCETPELRSASA